MRSSSRLRSDIPTVPVVACTNRHFSKAGSRGNLSIHVFDVWDYINFKYKCQQPDYSLLRIILPLMVLGSSVRNSTIRGYL